MRYFVFVCAIFAISFPYGTYGKECKVADFLVDEIQDDRAQQHLPEVRVVHGGESPRHYFASSPQSGATARSSKPNGDPRPWYKQTRFPALSIAIQRRDYRTFLTALPTDRKVRSELLQG